MSDENKWRASVTPGVVLKGEDDVQWTLENKIGEGGEGVVFVGVNKDKLRAAIKITDTTSELVNLAREKNIVVKLSSHKGFPGFHGYDTDATLNVDFMAMELLRTNLHKLVYEGGLKLTHKDVCRLGLDLLVLLEHMHSLGYVYNDLNYGNIMFTDSGDLKLVDFGCTRRWCDMTGEMFEDFYDVFEGSQLFGSCHRLQHHKSSRRMDMESLGYLLIHICNDTLPWKPKVDKEGITPEECAEVGKIIEGYTPADLCKGLPKCIQLLVECRDLKHTDIPNYDRLKSAFADELALQSYPWDLGSPLKRKDSKTEKDDKKKSKNGK